MKTIKIIGAGLAGSELAFQLAENKIPVELIEMRPEVTTKAHVTSKCAELVCSNSFRGDSLTNAVGLLKEELKLLNSLIMSSAIEAEVPAGGSLAVDRLLFSSIVDEKIKNHPLITFKTGEFSDLTKDDDQILIIATGPLTSSKLSKEIERICGDQNLAFFDAISPIVTFDSLDLDKVFRQSRYNKGNDDFLNIPLNQEEYLEFINKVKEAPKYDGKEEVEKDSLDKLKPFEGCMPIEDMISRGDQTLRFGPFKPKGLTDPKTEKEPYAVCQLRQDNSQGTLWNIVGLQTRMKKGAQKEILSTLPGLENVEFVRLGSFHRNTFINSPVCLSKNLEFKEIPNLFFAGQITGVEGYVESTACALYLANYLIAKLNNKEFNFPKETAMQSLINYITSENKNFQPMNISFGLIDFYHNREMIRKYGKRNWREKVSLQALENIKDYLS